MISLEQRILDALHEAPASKADIIEAFDLPVNTVSRAVRRLQTAGEIELIAPKQGVKGVFKAVVETTKLRCSIPRGVESAKVWNPLTDPKPEFLKRYREKRDA